MILIHGKSFGSTKSTRFLAALTAHLDANSPQNISYNIILYLYEQDF